MLHTVLQFPHISGPFIHIEKRKHFLAESGDIPAQLPVQLHDEVPRQKRNILPALPERRNGDADDTQPVEYVLPDDMISQCLCWRNVDVGNYPDIHLAFLRAAHPAHHAVLQNPQELCLQGKTHGIQLIQQEGAAVCQLEETGPLLCAGIGALLRAEQHGFQQVFRDGRAVDCDEGPEGPGAGVVDALGEQLLACARLPVEHDGRIGFGKHVALPDGFPENGALSDNVPEFVLCEQTVWTFGFIQPGHLLTGSIRPAAVKVLAQEPLLQVYHLL